MITELRLENWKSFKKTRLYIDPLSVLIGTNASGKSNILDALLFLQRMLSSENLTTALKGNAIISSLRGGIEWVARKPHNMFTVEIIVQKKQTTYKYRIDCKIKNNECRIYRESLISFVGDNKKILFFTAQPNNKSNKMVTNAISYDGRKQIFILNNNHHSTLNLLPNYLSTKLGGGNTTRN